MKIKQNNYATISLLKKLCRLSKPYQDKFKDFINILNDLELGTANQNSSTQKVKQQIKRALDSIRQAD